MQEIKGRGPHERSPEENFQIILNLGSEDMKAVVVGRGPNDFDPDVLRYFAMFVLEQVSQDDPYYPTGDERSDNPSY